MAKPWEQFQKQEPTQPEPEQAPWRKFSKTTEVATEPAMKLESGAIIGGVPEESKLEQAVEGVAAGVHEAVSPFTVRAEEFGKERSLTGTASFVISNVLAGMATGAAAGAAMGSVVVPGLGTVGGAVGGALIYGVYSGIGREYLRARHEDQDFNPLRAAVYAFSEANPLLKSASKSTRVIRAVGQIAAEGGAEYSYTQDPAKAAIAAGLSSVAAVAVFRSTPKAVNPKTAGNMAEWLTDEGPGILEAATERMRKEVSTPPADLAKAPSEFKRWIVNKPGMDNTELQAAFSRVQEAYGPAKIRESWDTWRLSKALVEEAKTYKSKYVNEFGKDLAEPTSVWGDWLKDGKFRARDVDRVLGINMEGALDAQAEARNAFDVASAGYLHVASKLKKQADKLGVSGEDISAMLRNRADLVSTKARKAFATDDGKKILTKWREQFDDIRSAISTAQYDIGYIDNYVPMQSLRADDLALALDRRWSLAQAGKLSTDEVSELRGVVASLVGEGTELTQETVVAAQKLAMSGTRDADQTVGAAFARLSELPEFIKEKDIYRQFTRYVHSNLKPVYFDRSMQLVRANLSTLHGAGLDRSAEYFTRYVRDMSGAKTGWQADVATFMNNKRFEWRKQLDAEEGVSALSRAKYKALLGANDFASFLSTMPYPSYLGLNLKATLRNYWQPLTVTAPELKGTYGYRLIARSTLESATDKAGGTNMTKYLQERRLLGEHFRGEGLVDEEVFGARFREAAQQFGDAAMWFYSKSDTINRYVTYKAGMKWASDIKAGRVDALKSLDVLSAGAKAQLRADKWTQMSQEELGDRLGRYLVGKTQFHYGREQLNQFGRSFGRMFSMFTKWPVMIGSDFAEQLSGDRKLQGALRLSMRYGAPWMALYGLSEHVLKVKESPELMYALGPLQDVTPVTSIDPSSFIQSLGGGPVLRIPADFVSGAMAIGEDKRPGEKAIQVLSVPAKTFVPGAAVVNELERWQKAHGQRTLTDQLAREWGR